MPTHFGPSWNLDGIYLWLGPTGAAGSIDMHWDSLFGADATVIRVREREAVGVIGVTFGASRWTEHTGGRLWLDGLVGTRLGRMVGLSAGPLIDFGAVQHTHVGGSIGVWAFLGVTPYLRFGALETSGTFAEIGVHIALPVLRH